MKTSLPINLATTLLFLFIVASAKGQTLNPAAPALGFHVFVQTDMRAASGNVAGAVAVGGDLTLAGTSSLAMNNNGAYPFGLGNNNNYGLVINGRIFFTSGNTTYVNRGYLRLGNTTGSRLFDRDQNNASTNLRITPGSFNSNPQLQLQRAQSIATVTQPHEINFANAFLQMSQFSASMNSLTPNSSVSAVTIPATSNPHIRLTANKINLINLTSGQLNALTNQGSIIFDNKPTATQPLIINVKVNNDFTWNVPNLAGIGDADGAYLIWNFYTTANLTVSANNSLFGTLMAPEAAVTKSGGGNFNGQIIAKSFTLNQGTINYQPLNLNLANIIPAPVMLPLDGIELSAQLQNDAIRLTWITYGESEMEAYVVESSTDGKNFIPITSVPSNGDGNQTYVTTVDTKRFNGNAYFRIRAVEKSGKIYYSKITLVKAGNTVRFQTWPNPVVDQINLSLIAAQKGGISVTLVNAASTVISQQHYQVVQGHNQWTINNLGSLPAGVYFLKIYNAQTGETTVQKFSR